MPHDTRHPVIARCRGGDGGRSELAGTRRSSRVEAGLLPLRNESCNEGDVTFPTDHRSISKAFVLHHKQMKLYSSTSGELRRDTPFAAGRNPSVDASQLLILRPRRDI